MYIDDIFDILDEEKCVLENSNGSKNEPELPDIEYEFDEMCDDINFNKYEEQ